MKKLLTRLVANCLIPLLICIFLFVFASPSFGVATKRFGRTALIGGTKSVDNVPYASLSDGDLCITTTSAGIHYEHRFDSSSAAAESSPGIIKPDDAGASNGRWILEESGLKLETLNFTLMTAAPGTPCDGCIYFADNDTWDPANIAGTNNYYVIYDGASYIAIFDEDGTFFISSIAVPTLEGDELNDTSSPHTLIERELKSTKLSNAGAGAPKTYTMPEHTTQDTWNLIVVCEDAQNIIIDPHANDTYTLNGTAAAQDENILNEACTAGESIAIYSTEVGVYLESKYADWKEDTP